MTLDMIQEVHTSKITSTATYEITIIPRYRTCNYEYLSQPLEDSFIGSGRKNGTRVYVHLCTKLIHNGSSGVLGELFENQD